MTLDVRTPGFVIDDPNCLWAERQLYERYKEACMPWEWHAPIMERARGHGLHCFTRGLRASDSGHANTSVAGPITTSNDPPRPR